MRLRRALAPAAGVGGDAVFRLRVILYQPLSRLRTRRLRGWSLSRPANITREVPDVQSEHSRRRPPDSADSCCPQAIISWWKVTNGAGNGGCSGRRRRGPWRSELLNYFLAPKLSGFRRGHSSLTTRYLRGDVIDQIFARRDSGTTYWTLGDRLGSVRDVVNNAGTVKDSIGYNGFGGITSESDSNFRGRYAWAGREINTEIELQYNRARYYDAGTGRWISQDPLGIDAGDSNLYRYVKNKGQQYADPSGLEPFLLLSKNLRKGGTVTSADSEIDGAKP